MWHPFRNIFGGSGGSVLGIDIGSASIKVVELSKRRGRSTLVSYGELALGPYAGGQIGQSTKLSSTKTSEALADLLNGSKIGTKNCGLAIPFGVSMVSAIEMPVVPEQELARVVPLEARKYIPVPLSEVTLDWWVVPGASHSVLSGLKTPPGQPPRNDQSSGKPQEKTQEKVADQRLDVLLVAIQNDILSRYQNVLTRTGLAASFFEIELFSTLRSIAGAGNTPQMIVDIGSATTKLYIVEGGVVRVSHVIPHGSEEITTALADTLGLNPAEAEGMKRDLSKIPADKKEEIDTLITSNLEGSLGEASRVLANYQKKYNRNVSQVFLVGGGAALGGILPIAKKIFQAEVVLGNPFAKVEVPAFMQEMLKTSGPEFAVAVGVGLRRLQEAR
jgi:type IV pilus assembly protein PilM